MIILGPAQFFKILSVFRKSRIHASTNKAKGLCTSACITISTFDISSQGKLSIPGTPPSVLERPCIELKALARQYSTASSSDTYTSCMTHVPTSPLIKGHNSLSQWNSAPTSARNSIYINPLGDSSHPSFVSLTSSNVANNPLSASSKGILHIADSRKKPMERSNSENKACEADSVFTGQIIQNLDSGLTARWQRFNSQPPLQVENNVTRGNQSNGKDQKGHGNHGGSLKRHRSENSHQRHLHFGEVMERTFSSTDNIHDMHGFPKPRLKFRKAVSLASKLHGSPSTGRKLANYHLIANPKSGRAIFIFF